MNEAQTETSILFTEKIMRLQKTFLVLILLFASFQICFGQSEEDTQPTDNWLKNYNIYSEQFLFHRYDRYSKEDITHFRKNLDLLNASKSNNEWEGIYSVGYEETVGFSQLRWKSDVGFVSFYIYTCLPELRQINYGKITDSPDAVQIIPEFAENSPRKQTSVRYVKVKWNDRRYLVEESSLLAFAEKTVGIYVEPEDTSKESYQKWANNWVTGDLEKPLTGLPEFPSNYKKFQRLPIEGKIISVGKRTIENEKTLGNTTYSEAAFYEITINAGKDKEVKEGMTFEIPEIESLLTVTQVNSNTAVGLISRPIDVEKNDECFDDNFDKILCPKIKNGLKAKTQIGLFHW